MFQENFVNFRLTFGLSSKIFEKILMVPGNFVHVVENILTIEGYRWYLVIMRVFCVQIDMFHVSPNVLVGTLRNINVTFYLKMFLSDRPRQMSSSQVRETLYQDLRIIQCRDAAFHRSHDSLGVKIQ